MRKYLGPALAAGILTVFGLFLPSRSRAVPLDVPYGNTTITGNVSGGGVVVSSASLPTSAYRWCLTHVTVSSPGPSTFTIWYSSMNTLTPSTTNYAVVIATGIPYDTQWNYRDPYCAPPANYIGMTDSVTTSTISYEGFSWGGWNNP